ncbi:hypothetical protein Tco_0304147, partial [Tanacetum coccineum]
RVHAVSFDAAVASLVSAACVAAAAYFVPTVRSFGSCWLIYVSATQQYFRFLLIVSVPAGKGTSLLLFQRHLCDSHGRKEALRLRHNIWSLTDYCDRIEQQNVLLIVLMVSLVYAACLVRYCLVC